MDQRETCTSSFLADPPVSSKSLLYLSNLSDLAHGLDALVNWLDAVAVNPPFSRTQCTESLTVVLQVVPISVVAAETSWGSELINAVRTSCLCT